MNNVPSLHEVSVIPTSMRIGGLPIWRIERHTTPVGMVAQTLDGAAYVGATYNGTLCDRFPTWTDALAAILRATVAVA